LIREGMLNTGRGIIIQNCSRMQEVKQGWGIRLEERVTLAEETRRDELPRYKLEVLSKVAAKHNFGVLSL